MLSNVIQKRIEQETKLDRIDRRGRLACRRGGGGCRLEPYWRRIAAPRVRQRRRQRAHLWPLRRLAPRARTRQARRGRCAGRSRLCRAARQRVDGRRALLQLLKLGVGVRSEAFCKADRADDRQDADGAGDSVVAVGLQLDLDELDILYVP